MAPAGGVFFDVVAALGIGLDVEGEGGDYDVWLRCKRFENLVFRLSFFVEPSGTREGGPS
ncbi:hypothetical protein AL486_19185 [Pandoraea apista]|nr:hypothetical protein AL486_19185 [Pandoraea apista]